MTLMEKLEAAGYPREKMYHHESDLYVFITPLTHRVIDEWFKEEGLHRHLFVAHSEIRLLVNRCMMLLSSTRQHLTEEFEI